MFPIVGFFVALAAALTGVSLLSARHASKTSPSSAPTPEAGHNSVPLTPATASTSSSTTPAARGGDRFYTTKPEDAVVTAPGWVSFRDFEVTALPLTDSSTGLFARLLYDDLLRAAVLLGGELLTEEDLTAIHEAAAAGSGEAVEIKPEPIQVTAENQAQMSTLAWAKEEDARILQDLHAIGYPDKTGAVPVSNVGKYWLPGGFNFGWWMGGKLIQSKGGGHIDPATGKNKWSDYSQLAMLKRKKAAA